MTSAHSHHSCDAGTSLPQNTGTQILTSSLISATYVLIAV
jgi:hypothetical protein